MAERLKNMKEALILAGISEINANGVHNFSVRRVADACNVSCAAPYKHFKDKRDFIAGIIEYVNGQWAARQEEILAACGDDLRAQLVEISVGYVEFLMEKPYYRSILLLKDEGFDNIYHRPKDHSDSPAQKLEKALLATGQWGPEAYYRKLHLIRALIFGTVFICSNGEAQFSETILQELRHNIDREFDLP